MTPSTSAEAPPDLEPGSAHKSPQHGATAAPKKKSKARTGHEAGRKRRGPLFWLVVLLLLGAGGAWLANFVHRSLVFQETDDAYVTGHIHYVSPEVGARVTEVLVKVNDTVKAGQPMARLDHDAFDIALQRANATLAQEKARIAKAKAALAQAKADQETAKAQSESAQAQVRQIEAQLQMANVNYARNQRLYKNDPGSVAGADIDATRITVEAATSALQKAKADLSAARARADGVDAAMESAQADVSAAMAQLAAQEAAVRDAQRQVDNTTLASPADGRVGQKNVEVGNLVQPGQPLFAVVGGDCWIVANFKESQIRKMEAGQPVEITVDAIAGHKFEGHVDSIAPATGAQFALLPPDNATGNFTKVVQRVPVKIVFDAESTHGFEARLRPGLSTVVSVRVKAKG